MEGLQRSTATFRRSGSSGLVWEDRFSKEVAQKAEDSKQGGDDHVEFKELRPSRSVGSTGTLRHGLDPPGKVLLLSNTKDKVKGGTGEAAVAYRASKDVAPVVDPPSPKVSACGFCGFFSASKQTNAAHKQRPKKARR